ncbi:mannose-1-phosphate guanyltransferase [Marinobacterium nitratireducens]|uniref:mannose-1-phosphate guanylyltransferase n=1 Tax=Marinobacterium nitratireducens TaxID=518897 RepID=A0A918DYH9_9GAMM|nr:mannose-1-phosphate guanyltransferase [Marinobacterium nitratireducens]
MKTVIMAGGSGSRLWPLSRELYPKQFLSLAETQTMLQATLHRVRELSDQRPMVICNEEHRFIVAEQLRGVGQKAEILLEPAGRNTAPAIALAALRACCDGEDPLLLVLAADHAIEDEEQFRKQVEVARPLAEEGDLVTFGIVANAAETGYGYIRRGAPRGAGYRVAEFVEKPDLKRARTYLSSGDYYWNSGIFLFRASRYLEELERFRPDIMEACRRAMVETYEDLDFLRINQPAFVECPSESIDFAVMEKTRNAVMVPLDTGWSDVGSWSSLWQLCRKDSVGNAVHGDVMSQDTTGSMVHACSRLVVTIGLKDMVVVETPDAVLVADKQRAQEVKGVVDELRSQGRTEYARSREVYRPWGRYDSIDQGGRYQVKRITVNPGAKLSVQMHHHRAEHWIVVSGTALVRRDEEAILLTENESTYIPVGVVHSLENPGKIPLELIEVQSGSYLGEDDIVRFEDKYGRN